MSAKKNESGKIVDKNVETTNPTLDDDNKSDSDEYEYEEIEVEEYEETVEESRSESPLRLTISEVETITPQDEKIKKETLILKSDGTTEIFEKEKKKSKVGRALTSQEESILLPLIQGLLAANNPNDQSKHENTLFREKESTTNAKDDKAVAIVNDNEKHETSLTQGANILGELSTALNRLQSTILEGKEVVSDTRKRNTILTLVAWLKRILQAPASEANSNITSNDAQICALTDLLPTELLLSKLMPQLNNGNDVNTTLDENAQSDERSPASSKRFSRQRNNRFNTIGVSKEELADARLYLQKKLLSENLAATDTKTSIEIDQQQKLLDDSVDTRRQSLNLSQTKNFGRNIDNILKCSKGTFSKSVDVAPSDDDSSLQNLVQSSKISESRKVSNARTESEQSMQNHSKVVYRKKSNSSVDVY